MDVIWGTPCKIIDGDTVEIIVTHYAEDNEFSYNHNEIIRIKGIDEPKLWSIRGARTKRDLQETIMGVELRLDVLERTADGILLVGLSLEEE